MSRNLIIEFLTSSLAIDINRSLSTVIFIIDASFNDASSFELSSIDYMVVAPWWFPRANPVIKTRSIQYMSPRKLVLGQHTIDISCWYSNGWYIFKIHQVPSSSSTTISIMPSSRLTSLSPTYSVAVISSFCKLNTFDTRVPVSFYSISTIHFIISSADTATMVYSSSWSSLSSGILYSYPVFTNSTLHTSFLIHLLVSMISYTHIACYSFIQHYVPSLTYSGQYGLDRVRRGIRAILRVGLKSYVRYNILVVSSPFFSYNPIINRLEVKSKSLHQTAGLLTSLYTFVYENPQWLASHSSDMFL